LPKEKVEEVIKYKKEPKKLAPLFAKYTKRKPVSTFQMI
jgi:hypothetical protein